MKYALSFFTVLILVISGMLFFQYQVYSDKVETREDHFTYTQEIEITYRNDSLDIRHHFKNLPNQVIDIQWPKLAVNPDCFIEAENTCKRLSEDKTKFEIGENHSQSLSYIIPLNNGIKSNQLLKDIFVSLKLGEVSYSTVHISTEKDVKGQWITGLPEVGQQTLSLVNYSMFGGKGPVSELYYNANNLIQQDPIDNVSIYSKKPLTKDFTTKLKELNFLNENHIVLVEGENVSKLQGKRILFLKDFTTNVLYRQVILSQVKAQFKFNESPIWLYETVASFLAGTTIGGEKSTEIVNTLTHQMTDTQLANWLQRLNDLKGKEISTKILDEALSEVFGIHTNYLSMNESTNEVFPFLFNDNREILVNSHLQKDINVIFKDGQILYSADALLKHLGYEASNGENGYYVHSKERNFRFPENHGFYVYNERRYNTVSNPIVRVAGINYIEETWLQKLFTVEIMKKDDSITIKTTTTQQ
ncbi:RNA polymerase II [Lysinibacillus endophyticus]|uniref:RNA polymerase II n=1 Tax=Ureibacillus endophyticus TaxID=1978490 RepID=UPI00209D4112|nr:RNA polymerase II [Lysinibacillus endophyticus]MCP1143918.1 RNA polymerase II [Lysinibacillus endophyticus]